LLYRTRRLYALEEADAAGVAPAAMMKSIVLLLVVLTTGCENVARAAPQVVLIAGQALQPPEDFALWYEDFDCGAQLIDTFKGTYRRTIAGPDGRRVGDVSTPLMLTRDTAAFVIRQVPLLIRAKNRINTDMRL
jgi:hypothetical protein